MIEKSTRVLILVTLTATLLYVGRPMFIPLAFAVLVSFVLYPMCKWLESRRVPRGLAIGIGLTVVTLLITSVVVLLVSQLSSFQSSWPAIYNKLSALLEKWGAQLTEQFGISAEGQKAWLRNAAEKSVSVIWNALFATGSSLVTLLIVPVYVALILYNRRMLVRLLTSFFPQTGETRVRSILAKTIQTYYNFIKGMMVVYLVVGLLNSIGLFALGIQQAFLFGFIASILTFIPYVGIMIASLLPITVAWITKDSIWYPLGVVGIFAVVQYLEANVIFPLAVSARLKINTLVTLVVMFIGGMLWGASGMILFIPFVAIAKLIADETDPNGVLARALGNGD